MLQVLALVLPMLFLLLPRPPSLLLPPLLSLQLLLLLLLTTLVMAMFQLLPLHQLSTRPHDPSPLSMLNYLPQRLLNCPPPSLIIHLPHCPPLLTLLLRHH